MIRPKPKIGLFSLWFFSVFLRVFLCLRAISGKLIKLEVRNLAEMFMNTHIFETHFFILQNFYFKTLKPLFIYVTVYLGSTFAQTYGLLRMTLTSTLVYTLNRK